ncbi:MAG: hypothetical protein LDL41_09690 [Coleofasciculus sp. S288]|nr:hypothetical protein [Coleofasciculus sp. S288]
MLHDVCLIPITRSLPSHQYNLTQAIALYYHQCAIVSAYSYERSHPSKFSFRPRHD